MSCRRWLVLGSLALLPAAAAAQVAPPPPPRLVVLCSVDQLASWVLAAAQPHFGNGGFERLRRDGVEFTRCAFVHGCTETGPGHATLGTGAPASVHGIVRNDWYDRARKANVYCAFDAGAGPLDGMPEGRHRSARNLLVPTVGDQLKQRVRGSKVVGVAWKDRAAILMSGQRADLAVWFEVATGRLVTNRAYVPAVPDWLRGFDDGKPLDARFGWEWQRVAPAAAYADLQDDRPFEAVHGNGSRQRTLPQRLTGGKDAPDAAFYTEAYLSPVANDVTLQAAKAAIEGEQLGADDVPDLLCLSFSATDTVGHAFGPDSVEARDTLLRLDRTLAELLDWLDQRLGRGRYAFVLSADHGIAPVPEVAKAQGRDAGRDPLLAVRARAAAEKALAALTEPPLPGRYIQHVADLGFYFDPQQLAAAAQARGESLEATANAAFGIAAAAACKVAHVQAAFATADLLGGRPADDPLRRAMAAAVLPSRVADVLLVVQPYWIAAAICSTHGSPHPYDREVPLLAMGPGLRAGARCEASVSPGLAAVLAARLLGIEPPRAATDRVPEAALGD